MKEVIKQYITTIAAITIAVIAVIVLRRYSPLEVDIFPRCIVKSLTGYECPGCGAQRALHELLNLNIGAAFRFNPLLVISIPYLILGFALNIITKHKKTVDKRIKKMRDRLYGRHAILIILCIIIIFTLLRNIL